MTSTRAVEASRRLSELIRAHGDLAHLGEGCDDATIRSAEDKIGIRFPPSYRLLVGEFGSWDIAGHAFLGVFTSSDPGLGLLGSVAETIDARRDHGLPDSLIVTMFDGMGGLVVLDATEVDDQGEYPVRVWHPGLAHLAEAETLGADLGSFALALCRRAVGAAQ